MQERAYLIDASMVFFKYYFSLPDAWQSECQQLTSSVYGFTHWMRRFLRDQNPKYVSACFDQSLSTCFRNQLYPLYKHRRLLPDENLKFQFNACQNVCELMGVPVYASTVFEADDLIGTLLMRHRKQGRASVIISRDKDLGQLLGEGDWLWHYPEGAPLKHDDIHLKFGVTPEQLADLQALCGDPIDDIPGVPGIGPKTAAKLLKIYPSIEALLLNRHQLKHSSLPGANRLQEKLGIYAEQILLAKKLTTIDCRARFDRRVSLRRRNSDVERLIHYCRSLGFTLDLNTQANPAR